MTDASAAYAARADEYTALFGSMDAVHDDDRELVARWAAGLTGRVVDAGCGPGHWTDFLALQGLGAEGVDLAEPFLERARAEPFDHAVTTAWFWPVDELTARLERAGFDVVGTAERTDPGVRPHGAISARRRAAGPA